MQIHGSEPPISSLTKMKSEPWKKWMNMSVGDDTPSFAQAHPAKAEMILDAIEFGIRVDFIGDRNTPVKLLRA